jgi:WD40 repeat protein
MHDLSTGADLGKFAYPGHVDLVALSHGGATLAVGYRPFQGRFPTVRVWDVKSGKAVVDVPMLLGVEAVAVSPDGKTLACGFRERLGITTLKLFALPDGHELGRAMADRTAVQRLAFSPDGRWLATSGSEGVLRVWDADKLDTRGR